MTAHRSVLQVAAVVVFIISRLFGAGYVLNFVITVLLLMLDFWTVRSCLEKQQQPSKMHQCSYKDAHTSAAD